MLSKTRLLVLLCVAACSSSHRGTTMVADGRRSETTDSSAELSEDLVRFSTAVIGALSDEARKPAREQQLQSPEVTRPAKAAR